MGEREDLRAMAANYEKSMEDTPWFFNGNLFLAWTYLNILSTSLEPLNPTTPIQTLIDRLEKVGSSIRPETPHSPWILASIMFTRAQYQMVKQDYQSKYDLTRAMLAIDPNSIGAHAMLADFFAYTGDIEGALRAYRRATDSGGSLVGVYLARAGYLNAINRHEAAIALLQSSLPMVPPIYGKCQLLISQASSNNRVRSH